MFVCSVPGANCLSAVFVRANCLSAVCRGPTVCLLCARGELFVCYVPGPTVCLLCARGELFVCCVAGANCLSAVCQRRTVCLLFCGGQPFVCCVPGAKCLSAVCRGPTVCLRYNILNTTNFNICVKHFGVANIKSTGLDKTHKSNGLLRAVFKFLNIFPANKVATLCSVALLFYGC